MNQRWSVCELSQDRFTSIHTPNTANSASQTTLRACDRRLNRFGHPLPPLAEVLRVLAEALFRGIGARLNASEELFGHSGLVSARTQAVQQGQVAVILEPIAHVRKMNRRHWALGARQNKLRFSVHGFVAVGKRRHLEIGRDVARFDRAAASNPAALPRAILNAMRWDQRLDCACEHKSIKLLPAPSH